MHFKKTSNGTVNGTADRGPRTSDGTMDLMVPFFGTIFKSAPNRFGTSLDIFYRQFGAD